MSFRVPTVLNHPWKMCSPISVDCFRERKGEKIMYFASLKFEITLIFKNNLDKSPIASFCGKKKIEKESSETIGLLSFLSVL